MADSMRWRYGETNAVHGPVARGTIIEIGDLLYRPMPGGFLLPARDYADAIRSAERFAGVAMQRSLVDEEAPIRVGRTGVYEFEFKGDFRHLPHLGQPLTGAIFGGMPCNQAVNTCVPELKLGHCAVAMKRGETTVKIDLAVPAEVWE